MINLPGGYSASAAPDEGAGVYAKKKRRKRAARVLRQKVKVVKKGGYLAFVKKYLKENKGKTIADAAKAYRAQNTA